MMHIWCLHGDLHKDKEKCKVLGDESLICYCCHMHKDHIIQLWCRIPIVLGAHVDEDC